jgi:hypothetical protein
MKTQDLIVAAAMLAGCATTQIPPDRWEISESVVRGAEQAGAASVPRARMHLQLAHEELALAHRLEAQGDARAKFELARAQADASLALELMREHTAHAEAQSATADYESIKRGAK